jgi:hypothetical protein
MAIEEIRPFITSRLDTLGLTEWLDGFADDNIPSTIKDMAYHQMVGQATAVENTAKGISFSVPIALKVFVKGFANPYEKIAEAQVLGESVIKAVTNPAIFRSGSITQIYFDSMAVVALDSVDDDNLIVIDLVFDCVLFLCFD